MGIQDRDYMRDRHRNSGRNEWRDRPLTPPNGGTSTLAMVLTWVSVAFVLYLGYEWLDTKQHRSERATPTRSAGTNDVPSESRFQEASIPHRTATPQESPRVARPQRQSAPPQVQQRAPEEVQHEEPAPQRTGGTIYLCRAYSGGSFWAQSHCNQHRALIDRIAHVPAGLPFAQQVHLAEQQRQEAAPIVSTTTVNVSDESAASRADACKSLAARLEHLAAMARQPQSGAVQDWIRGEERKTRDRQFALRC